MELIIPDALHVPPLHSQDSLSDQELTVYGRLFMRELRLTFFLLEIAEDGDTFSAYLFDPQNEQFGYFSFAYLEKTLPDIATSQYTELEPRLLVEAVAEERLRRFCEYGEPESKSRALAEHRAYYLAVECTPGEANEAKKAIEAILDRNQVNLSVIALYPGSTAYVVVIGDRPAEEIHATIMDVLRGKPLRILDYDLLMELFKRKLQANQRGNQQARRVRPKLKRKKPVSRKPDRKRKGRRRQ